MTNDEHVDELLRDLDVALSVEPSPAVAARVRSRIDGQTISHWLGARWILASAVVAAVILAAYLAWPVPQTKPSEQLVSRPEPQPVAPAPTSAAAPDRPSTSITRRRSPMVATRATEEPGGPDLRVLISPRQQLAMVQLRAALQDGRITSESLAPVPLPALPDPIVIDLVKIETVKIESPASPRAGGGELFAKRSGK